MTRKQLLLSTIRYYSKDPENRRCENLNQCLYSPVNAKKPLSKGCAIGRWLKPKDQILFDDFNGGGDTITAILEASPEYKKRLPISIRRLDADFLGSIQFLHDNDDNWDKNGLSKEGRENVNDIIDNWSIKMKKL